MKSGKIIAYSVLPGIWPRVHSLFGSGFGHMAFMMAVIYKNVGLLPAGHAYLNPQNFGKYGVRHVVAAATSNLEISKKNTDKVIIYFTILIGLIALFIQFILIAVSIISGPAFAGVWTNTFLVTPFGPQQDIAFIVLDQVFGVSNFTGTGGFFGSCYSDVTVDCLNMRGRVVPSPTVFPQPFHLALHQMLLFYSLGVAFLSGVVILYFVTAIVGETITTGTPFGQRFNKAWFVPRLIMFFALIAPMNLVGMNAGISAAQFITLGAAKFGSNMATNAWVNFSNTLNAAYVGDGTSTMFGSQNTLIAFPNVPSVAKLNQFMYLVRICMYAEKMLNNIEIRPYLVRKSEISPTNPTADPLLDFRNYLTTDFDEAVEFSRYDKVILRFGEFNSPYDDAILPGNHKEEWGYVKPYCGELNFDITAVPVSLVNPPAPRASDPVVTGLTAGSAVALGIQENYYLSIEEYLLYDPTFEVTAFCMLNATLPYSQDPGCVNRTITHNFNVAQMWPSHPGPGAFPNVTSQTEWLTRELAKNSINYYDTLNRLYITGNFTVGNTSYTGTTSTYYTDSIIGQLRANYDFTIPDAVLERGWVGMSTYYTEIADINGIVASAVQNLPQIGKYPIVMESIARQHAEQDANPTTDERFNPKLQNGKIADMPRKGDQYMAAAFYAALKFWENDNLSYSVTQTETGNAVIDTINLLLGTQGLFDMLENDGVHPLALLSALGKGMLDASIRNIFGGAGAEIIGALLKNYSVGVFSSVAGSFITKVGMIGISIGFVLYYVLPLLPFVYFFFAFGGWVKSIFEAMVAVPLWALAHIKIDGNGLPGPWATNGYFLLFEIFLRPTLIVFGFLAGITIFTALVGALNSIFDFVLLNVSGYDLEAQTFAGAQFTFSGESTLDTLRGPVDQIFFTAIYAIIVYMMALSSFKLIDQIPNSILRYMGVTVSTFQERSGDPAGQLAGKMFTTAQVTKAQLNQMIASTKETASGMTTDRQIWQQMGTGSGSTKPPGS